jgi:Ni/Fe-hydrogenase subunit HybB-like protein
MSIFQSKTNIFKMYYILALLGINLLIGKTTQPYHSGKVLEYHDFYAPLPFPYESLFFTNAMRSPIYYVVIVAITLFNLSYLWIYITLLKKQHFKIATALLIIFCLLAILVKNLLFVTS